MRDRRRLILGVCVLVGLSKIACANDASSFPGQARPAAPGYAAEARPCATCHSSVVRSFAENPHGQPPSNPHGKGVTCASCHGSQKAHVESGGSKSGMLDPALANAAQVDDVCLTCHAGKHATFARSAHGKSNAGCTSCHSIHTASVPKYLLKADQPELCYRCHADVKPQFSMASRHNVAERLVQCTDCHDPHGTSQEELPGSFKRQDAFCINCHTATAGPFRFEHAIVKTEGCAACHFPHGGPNLHLLRRANVDTICQTCHLPPPDPKTGAHMQTANAGPSKSCTDCHRDIHGSNSSPVFLRIE